MVFPTTAFSYLPRNGGGLGGARVGDLSLPGLVLGTTHSGYGTTSVWCRSGSRYVEGCWGFLHLNRKTGTIYQISISWLLIDTKFIFNILEKITGIFIFSGAPLRLFRISKFEEFRVPFPSFKISKFQSSKRLKLLNLISVSS